MSVFEAPAQLSTAFVSCCSGFVQWGLEPLQGGRCHSLPEQLDPVHCDVPVGRNIAFNWLEPPEDSLSPSDALMQHRVLALLWAVISLGILGTQWRTRMLSSLHQASQDLGAVLFR